MNKFMNVTRSQNYRKFYDVVTVNENTMLSMNQRIYDSHGTVNANPTDDVLQAMKKRLETYLLELGICRTKIEIHPTLKSGQYVIIVKFCTTDMLAGLVLNEWNRIKEIYGFYLVN